jgi:hypothetical protein
MKQQRSFEIIWDDVIIGTTSFEAGDPPMGVAFGSFLPNAAYRLEHLVDQGRLSARYAFWLNLMLTRYPSGPLVLEKKKLPFPGAGVAGNTMVRSPGVSPWNCRSV